MDFLYQNSRVLDLGQTLSTTFIKAFLQLLTIALREYFRDFNKSQHLSKTSL